jgi:hypothetical protein
MFEDTKKMTKISIYGSRFPLRIQIKQLPKVAYSVTNTPSYSF